MIFWLISSAAGCSYTAHSGELIALKRIGESQKEKQEYIEKENKYFDKLADDIKNNKLKIGVSKEQILSKYGGPVFCETEGETDMGQTCLYRDPLKYFSTERIYLYFDKEQKLSSWKSEPAGAY